MTSFIHPKTPRKLRLAFRSVDYKYHPLSELLGVNLSHLHSLISKGIEREKLLGPIKKTLMANFLKYVEEHAKYSVQIEGINKYIQSLSNLGLDRSKLFGLAKEVIISSFSKFVQSEKDNKNYDQKVKIFFNELIKFGIGSDTLEEIVKKHSNIIYVKDFSGKK